jgi:hypothetical protein
VREVIREVVQAKEHDLSECSRQVIDSPAACRRVIRSLDMLVLARSDPQWSPIRQELLKLAARIRTEDLKRSRWQRW